jgi:hypothetical protein
MDALLCKASASAPAAVSRTPTIVEKQETVVTPVALIFGYADNRSACQEIAEILIASRRAGTFKCSPNLLKGATREAAMAAFAKS